MSPEASAVVDCVAAAIVDLQGRTARGSTFARAVADRVSGEFPDFDRERFIADCAVAGQGIRLRPNGVTA